MRHDEDEKGWFPTFLVVEREDSGNPSSDAELIGELNHSPVSDLRSFNCDILIVTKASLYWMKGTTANPFLREVYLAESWFH